MGRVSIQSECWIGCW